MEKLIDLLASGESIKVDNQLLCDVKSFNYTLQNGKVYDDSITIYNERDLLIEGNAYSSSFRVKIRNKTIKDRRVKIDFQIDVFDMEKGDFIDGSFSIITNLGILKIPYHYDVDEDQIINSIKNIRIITDFYDIINNDRDLGIKIFNDKKFITAPLLQDTYALTIYEGLKKSSNNIIAIIEFFKAFNLNIVNIFENIDDKILKNYLDDTLDNLDISTLKDIDTENNILENTENIVENNIDENDDDLDKVLVNQINDKDLLEQVAIHGVRNNLTSEFAFDIYIKVLQYGSNIGGIFDQILISIPKDYKNKLPLYLYQYYHDEKVYTFDQKIRLYENIINAFNENDNIYKMFYDEIKDYARAQINQNRLNSFLIKIYNKILDENVVNGNNNKNILYILRSHTITTRNKSIRKVILKYKEIETENVYEFNNGVAYVPIFFNSYCLFFEDKYGNRFFNIDIEINKLFDKPNFEKYILDHYPDEGIINMMRLFKLHEIDSFSDNLDFEDSKKLKKLLSLNQAIINELNIKSIDYIFRKSMADEPISYQDFLNLEEINFHNLSIYDKRKIIKILINHNEYKYVYDLVLSYGIEIIETIDLERVLLNLINTNMSQSDMEVLNAIAFDDVKSGTANKELISYLISNYNGDIDNMHIIDKEARKLQINDFSFLKKILILMLSTNYENNLDEVFSYYISFNDKDEIIIKAYLTYKCSKYFLEDENIGENVINVLSSYLMNHINDFDNVPLIYLLSVTKFISGIKVLYQNDLRRILTKAMDVLFTKNLVFAYYKKLNTHYKMPISILNKEYIEYHADHDIIPVASISISDNYEKKEVELTKMYKNIYIKKITVYKNEILNYEIYSKDDPGQSVLQKGSLTYDDSLEKEYNASKYKTTYEYINDLISYLDNGELQKLKILMQEMILNQEISNKIFSFDGSE